MKSGNRPSLTKIEPTPPDVYFNRRKFIKAAGYGGVFAATGGVWGHRLWSQLDDSRKIIAPGISDRDLLAKFPFDRSESFAGKGMELTDRIDAGTHNNFYEFLPGRGGEVYRFTDQFKVDPWKVEVTGLCNKPRTFDLDDLFKFAHEERVYRHRCVETWSMVVPWSGFALSKLLEAVEPKADAKFVRFETANKPEQMPGIGISQRQRAGYAWPYHEGLRMDEAMNPLAMVVTGIYGNALPKQHGAPIRIIVPWKYGYKSPKSIVKIELLAQQPKTFWARAPYLAEYGFLSNVNPNIPHPRWSQAMEYELGTSRFERFPTKLFNGYGDHVAKLYPDEPTRPQKAIGPNEVAR